MGRLSATWLKNNGYATTQVFIETGTSVGTSAKYCAALFPEVHTIELGDLKYSEAKRLLVNYPNITCHHGSSPDVLRRIIDPSKSTLVWCDAHWVASDPNAAGPDNQCPLMEELESIFAQRWTAELTILIDDAHYFQESFWRQRWSRPYDKSQWPRMREIRSVAAAAGFACREREDDVLVIEKVG